MSASSVLSVYKDSTLKTIVSALKTELEESLAFNSLIEQKLNVESGIMIQEVQRLSLGLNHNISYYEDKLWINNELKNNNGYFYFKNNPEQTVEIATNHLNSIYKNLEKIHESNILAIDNNKKVWESVSNFMLSIGIARKYSTYETKSSRSTKKVQVEKHSGWLSDLYRLVIVDDGWKQVEIEYKKKQEDIAKYLKDKQREVELKKNEELAKQKEKSRLEIFATLKVKYGLDYEAGYDEILLHLLNKDKYLNLAHAMSETRGDWSDGFYRVENALGSFTTESDEDNRIAEEIDELTYGDERDGRIFRDCKYNYTILYSMVNSELLTDYTKLIEYSPL